MIGRFFRFFLIPASLLIAATGCSSRHGTVTIRLVGTSDVHGSIFDTDCLTGEERRGSLAKFSTFLNRQRKEYKHVVYLDAGDNLQGSVDVYQDVTAQLHRTSLPAQAFSILGCDASVMGNHDFAVGVASYERFFRGAEFPVLGANACFEETGDYLPPYRMLNRGGVRIAVLGLTTPIAKYALPSDCVGELELLDVVETARQWVPYLKEEKKADVVIGLLHTGLQNGRVLEDIGVYENSVRRLISQVPGFNVIVYGHDHQARCLKEVDCNGDSVLLLNPGEKVSRTVVATIDVVFDDKENPSVTASGSLVDISAEEPDKDFMNKLSGWYDDVKHYADSAVGTTSVVLEANGILWRNSTIMDYIHSIQLGYNGAQISLASPLFAVPQAASREISMRDLFSLCQGDNAMVSVMLKGSEVRDLLEYSADMFYNTVSDRSQPMLKYRESSNGNKVPRRSVSSLITAAGIDYVIDVTQPNGKRVRILSLSDGKPFDPDSYYRTVISSALFSSSGSALLRTTGMTLTEIQKRLNGSSAADLRYFMITDLSLRKEMDMAVKVKPVSTWKLVPENVVSACLAKDTVNFSIMNQVR